MRDKDAGQSRRPKRLNAGVVVLADTTSLDIATAIVAGYAALVATLALAFNVFSWLRTWQTRLTVDLRRMQLMTPGVGSEPVVLFALTNHSGHRVKVTHVPLKPLRRGGDHLASKRSSHRDSIYRSTELTVAACQLAYSVRGRHALCVAPRGRFPRASGEDPVSLGC